MNIKEFNETNELMATDQTPPGFERLLGILKHALRSIESHCRRGLVPSHDRDIRRHTANIRQAADGLDSLADQIKEPPKATNVQAKA